MMTATRNDGTAARVVVVGGGGREHAIADALLRSPQVAEVWMTAHNAGTAGLTRLVPAADFSGGGGVGDGAGFEKFAAFCRREAIDLVVVGPEQFMADGIADALTAAGVCVLAPTRAAARLESSKIYAKRMMKKCGVRTADFSVCETAAQAAAWFAATPPPYVLKADGLAAGKGVLIADDAAAAQAAAEAMLGGQFAESSRRLVLEQHLRGEEMSFIALVAGDAVVPLATSRDYKRLHDGDTGPNTGGMGVVSPAPTATPALEQAVVDKVMMPILAGLRGEGESYCGFLYAGLMINGDDIFVLEFNCRLGDPEAQVILPRLKGDWYPALLAAAQGKLASVPLLKWRSETAVGIVLAAAGYPENPRKGDIITLPDNSDSSTGDSDSGVGNNSRLYHAGTKLAGDGSIITAGGRVLTVVELAATQPQARTRAYATTQKIHFPGTHHRHDIAL